MPWALTTPPEMATNSLLEFGGGRQSGTECSAMEWSGREGVVLEIAGGERGRRVWEKVSCEREIRRGASGGRIDKVSGRPCLVLWQGPIPCHLGMLTPAAPSRVVSGGAGQPMTDVGSLPLLVVWHGPYTCGPKIRNEGDNHHQPGLTTLKDQSSCPQCKLQYSPPSINVTPISVNPL